jgi:signal transduction histidine kinase
MIARKLIMIHGGDIELESKVDEGCKITIRLPIE